MNQERNTKPRKPLGESSGAKAGTGRPDEQQYTLNRPKEVSQIPQSPTGRENNPTSIAGRKQEKEYFEPPREQGIERASNPKPKRANRGRAQSVQNQPILLEQPTFEPPREQGIERASNPKPKRANRGRVQSVRNQPILLEPPTFEPPREQGIERASNPKPKRANRGRVQFVRNQPILLEQPTFQPKDQTKLNESKPSLEPQKATFTGFRELPIGKAFLILLLWIPRFFIPWITAWHELNVYILSNPWHWKDRQSELLQQKIYVLVGKSIIAILCSVIVDLIRRKWELDFYAYLPLLVLFTCCPLAGGLVARLLRNGLEDVQVYKDWWFTSIGLMLWAMSVAFMMFPVQFSCIYTQHDKMSRNAHYNWTAFFVMLEFINAYVAFLVIPGPCPTPEWTQIAVWAGIFLLMATITILTLIFLFAVKLLRYVMVMCCQSKTAVVAGTPDDYGPFVDAPFRVKKLMWFSMSALPVICSQFLFSVIERFVNPVPYEDWDEHRTLSALGIFLFCKIMGVIVTAFVVFTVRKILNRTNPSSLKGEMIYLGLPHCLCILALLIMVGRLATLSHLKEGDIIDGPIPNKDKAVLVFVNAVFRNVTICISSEYFRPVKIRPYHHVTREIYDIGDENFTVTMQVDPCLEPAIKTTLKVRNMKKGEWKIFKISLFGANIKNLDIWDYYRTLISTTLVGAEDVRPKVGPPQMLLFQWDIPRPPEIWYFEMNHSSSGSRKVPVNNSISNDTIYTNRNSILWEVPEIGSWKVRMWCVLFSKSDVARAWVSNCTQCSSPLEFTVENNSLYLLVEYGYEERRGRRLELGFFDNPPPYLPRFPMFPRAYVNFKLGEVAGPNSDRLPSNKELRKDWAVKVSMALAGMAAGGIFLGFVYIFWVDPPVPQYRIISLAVCWVLMGVASEIPRIKMIEFGVGVSCVLLSLQIVMTASHFIGAYFMSNPTFNFRTRPD